MHEGAPQPHTPEMVDDFNDTHHESESSSPMEQKLDFSVDIVFDDLENIIPQYNKFIEDKGDKVPEEMILAQNKALETMREIKKAGMILTSKQELIDVLTDMEIQGSLMTEVRELIEGIL